MRTLLSGAIWLTIYLGIVLAPIAALLLVPTPEGGGFFWDVSMGLGFAGITMMAVQFVLTARFKSATAPFGIDVIYAFHRYLAYALLVLILLHPVILIWRDPSQWEAVLTPWRVSFDVSSGTASLFLLLVVVGASAFRKQLRIPYESWRATHLFLSIGAIGLAFYHMLAISHYTGAPAVRGLWLLIGFSLGAIVVFVRILRPWWLLHRPWRIAEIRADRAECWTVAVDPVGHSGFRWEPGQFAWLTVDRSPFVMHEHPFSIASTPTANGRVEFLIKELGDFTSTIGRIPPGTLAYVDGPYGSFSIDRHPEAAGYVFMSGGIGVAPMLSMLRALAERGDERRHLIFTGHSTWDRVPARDELARLERDMNLKVIHVLEEPPEAWDGEKGWITREMLDRHLPPDRGGYHYFICGPVPMIRAMETFLGELGVPRPQVHTELFDMV